MLSFIFAAVSGRIVPKDRGLFFSHQSLQQDCNCDWITTPGACNTPDGTYCWSYCCKGPVPTPSPGPVPPPGDYKPMDLTQEYYEFELTAGRNLTKSMANGFSRQGGMRYHSTKKVDLLGGGLRFTADISRVNNLVNANLYIVIPGTLMGGSHFYCDNSDGFVKKGNACIELDIFESNGHSLSATTMHTKVGTGDGCDTWGCRQITYLNGDIDGNRPIDVEVNVSNDGDIVVLFRQGGKTVTAFQNAGGWDGAAKAAVVDGMRNHGAVVVSSMWTGWVPPNTSGTGDLNGSHYTVSNLMYSGRDKGNTF